MKTACITTVCTDDRFQYYIPMFIHTCKRAYPEYPVKVFLRGRLDDITRSAISLIPYKGYTVEENFGKDFPHRVSSCNSIRFILGKDHFPKCDIVYFTDVDFLICNHVPLQPLADFYWNKMEAMGQPCLAARGPISGIKRPEVCESWDGKFTRIAAGVFGVKYPDYFDATKKARRFYEEVLKSGRCDGHDNHAAASYREYDEVMLCRILKDSKLKIPKSKYRYVNGEVANSHYRSIHVGDFKTRFRRRFKSMSKMCRILSRDCVRYFDQMDMFDKRWKKIADICMLVDKDIDKEIRRIRKHCKKRAQRGL